MRKACELKLSVFKNFSGERSRGKKSDLAKHVRRRVTDKRKFIVSLKTSAGQAKLVGGSC